MYFFIDSANVLFKLLNKYSPEDTKQRRARLTTEAKLRAESISPPIQKNKWKMLNLTTLSLVLIM